MTDAPRESMRIMITCHRRDYGSYHARRGGDSGFVSQFQAMAPVAGVRKRPRENDHVFLYLARAGYRKFLDPAPGGRGLLRRQAFAVKIVKPARCDQCFRVVQIDRIADSLVSGDGLGRSFAGSGDNAGLLDSLPRNQ